MIHRIVLPILVLALGSITQSIALRAAEAESPAEQIKKSLQTWQDLKVKCAGNYSYKIRWQNNLGFGHETVLLVRSNQVVERKFNAWRNDPSATSATKAPAKLQTDTWTEKDSELGKHKKGAPVKTLDQLYQEAEKLLTLKSKQPKRLHLLFDKQGLLLGCFWVDPQYADDAPRKGISIDSIQLELPQN